MHFVSVLCPYWQSGTNVAGLSRECHESRSHQRSIEWRQQEDGDSAYWGWISLQFSNFDIDEQLYINIHNRLDKAPMNFLEICKVLNH